VSRFFTVLLLSTLATKREMRVTYSLPKIEGIRIVFKDFFLTQQSNVLAGGLDVETRTLNTLAGIQEVLV